MPDRVLHAGIWTSDRFLGLGGDDLAHGDALRLLFLRLVSVADDLGNAECSPAQLAIYTARPVSRQNAGLWITSLAAVDLVRPYEVDGKQFVHIPRFRQRLRSLKKTHPPPPVLLKDKDLTEALVGQLTDERTTVDRQVTDERPAIVGRLTASRAAGIESNRIESNRSTVPTATSAREAIAETSKPIDKISEVKTESNGHGEAPELAPQERVAELAAKLTKPPSGERHRTRDEQLAAIAALTAKGRP